MTEHKIICIYKSERYLLSDNGAVLRYPLEGFQAMALFAKEAFLIMPRYRHKKMLPIGMHASQNTAKKIPAWDYTSVQKTIGYGNSKQEAHNNAVARKNKDVNRGDLATYKVVRELNWQGVPSWNAIVQ